MTNSTRLLTSTRCSSIYGAYRVVNCDGGSIGYNGKACVVVVQ